MSNSLQPHGLWPTRLLCLWDVPSKNTRMGCHLLLWGIFPTQGLNLCLLHWQEDSLLLSHQGSSPKMAIHKCYFEKQILMQKKGPKMFLRAVKRGWGCQLLVLFSSLKVTDAFKYIYIYAYTHVLFHLKFLKSISIEQDKCRSAVTVLFSRHYVILSVLQKSTPTTVLVMLLEWHVWVFSHICVCVKKDLKVVT